MTLNTAVFCPFFFAFFLSCFLVETALRGAIHGVFAGYSENTEVLWRRRSNGPAAHTYIHISWQTHIDRIGGSLCRHIHIYIRMDMDLGARTSCHDIDGSSWMDGGHREEHT